MKNPLILVGVGILVGFSVMGARQSIAGTSHHSSYACANASGEVDFRSATLLTAHFCSAPDDESVDKQQVTAAFASIYQNASNAVTLKACATDYNGSGGHCSADVSTTGSGYKTLTFTTEAQAEWTHDDDYGYVKVSGNQLCQFSGIRYAGTST